MFGGYKYHYFPYQLDKSKIILKKIKNTNSRNFDEKVFTFLNQGLSTTDGVPYFNRSIFSETFLKNFYFKDKNSYKNNLKSNLNFLKKSQLLDINFIKIPRVLKYTDRLSMNYGVESRVPFLDHNLFFYSFHLKNSDKFKSNQSRYLFKKAFEDEKITKFFSKTKKTIVDPQTSWLRKELKDYVYDNFNSSILRNCEYFNYKNILNYLKKMIVLMQTI